MKYVEIFLDSNATDALEKCGHTIDPNNPHPQYTPRQKSWGINISKLGSEPELNEHDKVVKILKGDFEKKFGMTYDRFVEIYNEILKNNPEKLI